MMLQGSIPAGISIQKQRGHTPAPCLSPQRFPAPGCSDQQVEMCHNLPGMGTCSTGIAAGVCRVSSPVFIGMGTAEHSREQGRDRRIFGSR